MVAKIANRRSALHYVTVQLLRAPIVFGISNPVTLLGGPIAGMASRTGIMVAALVIQLTFRSPWEQAPVVAASADQLPVVPVR